MSKLKWDNVGERFYETGVSNCVLYPRTSAGAYPAGVAWNGITGVTESPSGAEPTALYADNIKYLNILSAEQFGATIEAYMYPDEFNACEGSVEIGDGVLIGQQTHQVFGLVYKTIVGNDTEYNDHAYKLHIIYGAQASASEKARGTVNDTPDALTFSWEVSTTPVEVAGFKPTSKITIDSRTADATKLAALEKQLFGADVDGSNPAVVAHLLMPDQIKTIMAAG